MKGWATVPPAYPPAYGRTEIWSYFCLMSDFILPPKIQGLSFEAIDMKIYLRKTTSTTFLKWDNFVKTFLSIQGG